MSVPKSITKIKKGGIEYVSSIDRTQYTIQELTRAAMRDVGKLLVRRFNEKAQKLPGLKKTKRVFGRTSTFQYWARKNELDCLVGTKDEYWYSFRQELGTKRMKKLRIMTDTTYENIKDIVDIESHYLELLGGNEANALRYCDEREVIGGDY